MQARIKIIKRGAGSTTTSPTANEIQKTVQQSEREMANTVKSWVTEWEARKSALKTAASLLVRSLGDARGSSAQQFAAVNR
jgi:tRNA A58 N-methylase Trm61